MKYLFFTFVFLICSTVFAGPGGGHSHSHGHSHKKVHVTKEQTQQLAKVEIDRLIKFGKLESSWSEARYEQSELKMFGKKNEWVVTYINEKDEKNKKLYIFLKQTGEFVAANFTGK